MSAPRSYEPSPMAPRVERETDAAFDHRKGLRQRSQPRSPGFSFVVQMFVTGVAFTLGFSYFYNAKFQRAINGVVASINEVVSTQTETDSTQKQIAAVDPFAPPDTAVQEQGPPPAAAPPPPPAPPAAENVEPAPAATPPAPVPLTQADPLPAPALPAPALPAPALPAPALPAAMPIPDPEPPVAAPSSETVADSNPASTAQATSMAALSPALNVTEPAKPADAVSPEQPVAGKIFRDCDSCPELVMIVAGEVTAAQGDGGVIEQASDDGTGADMAIAHAFAIGRYEITFDDWGRCVADGGCSAQPDDDGWGRGRRPVIRVSYNDIIEQYLPWLSRTTGHDYRLPTAAEWDYAAHGGLAAMAEQAALSSTDARPPCAYGNFSDAPTQQPGSDGANGVCSDGFANTAPVGSMKANSFGIFDMQGNVWEWVADCWHPSYGTEPQGEGGSCNFHVLRGGSWASEANATGQIERGWEKPEKAKNSVGFRVVRSQS